MREPVSGDVAGADLPKYRPARPLVKVALGYMAGLVTGWSFPLSVTLLTSLLILALAVILLLALRRVPGVRRPIWICSVFAVLLLGAVRAELLSARQRRIDDQVSYLATISPVTLSGQVAAPPSVSGNRVRVLLSHVTASRWRKTYRLPGLVDLQFRKELLSMPAVGSQVQAQADISVLRGAMLPGGFSPRDFYYARSQVAHAYANEEAVTVIPSAQQNHLWDWFKESVWSFSNEGLRVVRENFPPREAGLLAALAFGIRTELPQEVRNAFRQSGLAHITVVSGLHLTLLLSGLLWLLKFLGLRRRVAFILAVPFLAFFLLLVGPRIPILRATSMALLLMMGIFLERPVDRLNVLAVAALLILLPWPDELRQPSFQLSFLAVVCLVLVVPPAAQFLSLPTRLPWSYFAQLFVASVVVSVAIAPLTIYHFHLWSPIVIIGNLIAIPLLILLLPILYLFLILHHIGLSLFASFLIPLVGSFAKWMVDVAEYLASVSWGHIEITRTDLGLLSAALLTLLSISLTQERRAPHSRRSWRPILVCLALVAAGIWYDAAGALWQPLRVDFLALGQGDCTFIRTPRGATVLVDGGPAPRNTAPGRDVPLVDYLLNLGVRRINLLVLTHPQADHIGSLPQVLARFPIDLVLDPGMNADTLTWRRFRHAVLQNGARWEVTRAGDEVTGLGNVQFEVLHPQGPRARRLATGDTNEDCVILLVTWRDIQILLTGDIGFPSEEGLFDSIHRAKTEPLESAKTMIIKVPHHGSRYSSSWEFIEDVEPVIAVAEVGRNPYGHPHQRTIRRYRGMGAQFFRTDWYGTVRIRSNGANVRVITTRRGAVYNYIPEQAEVLSSRRGKTKL